MKNELIEGRIWVIRNRSGSAINDITTDQIYHYTHLAVSVYDKMGTYVFGNLPGWKDFPQKTQPGDIVVCGKNFGTGPSRPQAADCFKALGISLIIAESFDPCYKRNAINSGLPVLVCPDICSRVDNNIAPVQQGDILNVNLKTAEILNVTRNIQLKGCQPASQVQLAIYHAGGLFKFTRTLPVD